MAATTSNVGLKLSAIGHVALKTSFTYNMNRLDAVLGDISAVTDLAGSTLEAKLQDAADRIAALEAA